VTALGKLFRTTVFKLTAAFVLLFALGSGLVLGRVGWNVRNLMDDQILETIDADIKGLAEQYADGGIRELVSVIERRTRQPGASLYLVANFAGDVIVGNLKALPDGVLSRAAALETSYERLDDGKKRRALARVFILPGKYRLLVGHDIEEREQLRKILAQALATSLLWLVLIGAIGGLFVARRVLRRVDSMNATAQTIMAGDLGGRLAVNGSGDELDRLARNLNAMLDRIGELMAGMKEVTDNIAHDLKTPLTRLRNEAEQTLRAAPDAVAGRAALEKVIEESDGLIRIFNALLMIARAEAGNIEGVAEFDAAEVLRDVAEMYEPVAEDAEMRLVVAAQAALPVRGNRELIGQTLANLVDNAIKYGAPPEAASADDARREVTLTARRQGGAVELVVADHGPGIAVADRARVLDRFVRLENSRSRPGSGLGLSLAAAVARLHGGVLRIEDNAPGLRVVIALSASPPVNPSGAAPSGATT
jgi:signal transduction histidine kinase